MAKKTFSLVLLTTILIVGMILGNRIASNHYKEELRLYQEDAIRSLELAQRSLSIATNYERLFNELKRAALGKFDSETGFAIPLSEVDE